MDYFDKSEVMMDYANKMHGSDILIKEADWNDVLQNLGFEALFALPTAATAASGAMGASSLGLTPMVGAVAATLPMTPVGWIAMAVGAVATIGGLIYAYNLTNDNVEDLIDKLEALDPNPRVKYTVDNWISTLGQYQSSFESANRIIPSTTNDDAKGKLLVSNLNNMTKLQNFLEGMQKDWVAVKSNLTDWGIDGMQAESTLNKTLANVTQLTENIKNTMQNSVKEYISKIKTDTQTDYPELAKEIVQLHAAITQVDGHAPVYEPQEAGTLAMVRKLNNNEATVEDLKKYGPHLIQLRNDLQKLLEKAKSKKSASLVPAISKRAVRLYSDPAPSKDVGRKKVVKDRATELLQNNINHLNVAYKTGANRIAADGIYGPLTASALLTLLKAVPEIADKLRKYGIDSTMLSDYGLIKSNPQYVRVLAGVLNGFVQSIMQDKEVGKEESNDNRPCKDKMVGEVAEGGRDAIIDCLRKISAKDYHSAYDEGFSVYDFIVHSTALSREKNLEAVKEGVFKYFIKAESVVRVPNKPTTIDAVVTELFKMLAGGKYTL